MKTHKLKQFKVVLIALFTIMAGGIANAATFTALTSGNWSSAATWGGTAPSSIISIDDIVIPAGITVTLDQNVEFEGALSSLEVMGVLKSSTTSILTLSRGTISGTGEIDINALVIGSFGTSTFTGDFTVKAMTTSSTNLVFTSLVNVTDSLFLKAGKLSLNTGGNLSLKQNSTIVIDKGTLLGNGGLLSTTTMYNVAYVGSTKDAGMELTGSGSANVIVDLMDNNQDLKLTSNTVITGTLDQRSGKIDLNSNTLTIEGDYKAAAGVMIKSDNMAEIVVKSNGNLTSGFMFDSNNNSIGKFVVDLNSTGKAEINSDVEIMNELMLDNGDLELNNNAELSLGANAKVMIDSGAIIATNGSFKAASSYNVTYMGTSKNSSVELSGNGLNNVTIDLADDNNSIKLTSDAKVNGNLNISKGKLELNDNDLELSGNFSGSANAKVKGSSNSNLTISSATKLTQKIEFDASGNMLNGLTINIGDGSDFALESDLTVKQVTLVKGGIEIKDNTLTIDNGGSITGSTTTRYIKITGTGTLDMMVDASGFAKFPVGTSTSYSPANLKLNSGTASKFMVNVTNGVKTDGTFGSDMSTTRSIVNRTWDINTSATGNVDVDMKLEWTAAIEANGFDRSKAFISHFTNGDWDVTATAAATTTANSTFELERKNITTFSPFAVADNGSALNIAPATVAINKMYPNPVTNKLICELDINSTTQVEVMDLQGRVLYSNTINANNSNAVAHTIDFSTIPSGVYFVKVSSNDTQVIQKVVK